MGLKLVRAALKVDKVRPRARLVLTAMAALALDTDRGNRPGHVYYGGRHMLLAEIGIRPTTTTLRHLQADVTELTRAGLIVRVSRSSPETTAVYRLCITDP